MNGRKEQIEAFCFHVSGPFAISPLFLLCHLVRKNTEGPYTRCTWQFNSLYHYKLQVTELTFSRFSNALLAELFWPRKWAFVHAGCEIPQFYSNEVPLAFFTNACFGAFSAPFFTFCKWNETKLKLKRWTRINIYPLTLHSSIIRALIDPSGPAESIKVSKLWLLLAHNCPFWVSTWHFDKNASRFRRTIGGKLAVYT